MKYEDLITEYGTAYNAAKMLKFTTSRVYKWKKCGFIPIQTQLEIEKFTEKKFTASLDDCNPILNTIKIKNVDDLIFDECIHFLSDLNAEVQKRGHEEFEYLASDARSLQIFISSIMHDIKVLKKKFSRLNKVESK